MAAQGVGHNVRHNVQQGGTQGVLKEALRLFRNKKYTKVISLLEPNVINYRNSFEFFYMLGVSCMYMGDIGGANSYFQRARQLKTRDTRILAAQAALFLRRGDVNQAVEYYLEILDYEPGNKLAKRALEFIRKKGDPDTISEWMDSGKITRFYPKTKGSPGRAVLFSLSAAAGVAAAIIAICIFTGKIEPFSTEQRANLSDFQLTRDERSTAIELGGTYRYILSEAQVLSTYKTAQSLFQRYRDNASRVEINRLLNSNASTTIRQKARLLVEYMEEPDFTTIGNDTYSYTQAAEDPYLYLDCWVIWSGRVTNVTNTPSSTSCDFLIGSDNLTKIEGIIPVQMDSAVSLDPEKPLRILGQIALQDGKLLLKGRSVHQPVQPSLPPHMP
jgi:tetratricopeptide (TPR) repeat protein